jgi:hypothetical protein
MKFLIRKKNHFIYIDESHLKEKGHLFIIHPLLDKLCKLKQ